MPREAVESAQSGTAASLRICLQPRLTSLMSFAFQFPKKVLSFDQSSSVKKDTRTKMIAALLVSALALSGAVSAQPAVACRTLECLVANTQYTVLGRVVSNNQATPPGSAANFNATIEILCNWATNRPGPQAGVDVQGTRATVTGFALSKTTCGQPLTVDAPVDSTRIYFIYVQTANPIPGSPLVFGQPQCASGFEDTPANRQVISSYLGANPGNAISARLRGPASQCTLPGPPVSPTTTTAAQPTRAATGTPAASSTPIKTNSAQSLAETFVGFLAMAWLYLF